MSESDQGTWKNFLGQTDTKTINNTIICMYHSPAIVSLGSLQLCHRGHFTMIAKSLSLGVAPGAMFANWNNSIKCRSQLTFFFWVNVRCQLCSPLNTDDCSSLPAKSALTDVWLTTLKDIIIISLWCDSSTKQRVCHIVYQIFTGHRSVIKAYCQLAHTVPHLRTG